MEPFTELPGEWDGAEELFIECNDGELDGDCDWWTTMAIDPDDIRLDEDGFVHFENGIPTECPRCHNYVYLKYNGVEVFYEP